MTPLIESYPEKNSDGTAATELIYSFLSSRHGLPAAPDQIVDTRDQILYVRSIIIYFTIRYMAISHTFHIFYMELGV